MQHFKIQVGSDDNRASVYEKLLSALGAPDWHGHNLDALWDTVSGDDINSVRAPYRIDVVVMSDPSAEVEELIGRIEQLFVDARQQGSSVALRRFQRNAGA